MKIFSRKINLTLNLKWIFVQFFYKSIAAIHRLFRAIKFFPIRLRRLLQHIWVLSPRKLHENEAEINKDILTKIIHWIVELGILIWDSLAVAELYETIADFIKFNTRPMHDWEIKLAKTVFGNAIDYRRVRIDEYAFIGAKQYRICYVSFYTINSWGAMENSTLLHELTHVWQYEHLGAVYIPRALRAQFSKMGYNYGGVSTLKAYLEKGKDIFAFNLEQQGDIISDYYRIKNGYHPRWGDGRKQDLPIYENYIKQLK